MRALKSAWLRATNGGVRPRKKDRLEGCDADLTDEVLAEEDVELFCLFADVDMNNYAEVENRKSDIEALAVAKTSSVRTRSWA